MSEWVITSVAELNSTFGLAAPKRPLLSVIDLSAVSMPAAKSAPVSLRIDLYGIVVKACNNAAVRYGRHYFDFSNGVLYATAPGQSVTLEASGEVLIEGRAIYFHPDLLIGHPLQQKIRTYGYFAYDVHEALHLSEQEKGKLHQLVQELDDELHLPIDSHSRDVELASLDLILNYANRYFHRQFVSRRPYLPDIAMRLNEALEAHYQAQFPPLPGVAQIARRLCMSPDYLTDLLKEETGRGAQEHIHRFIVERAQQQLLGSSQSVSEIAYALGFEYPQYFSKLFKRETGLTPLEFREAH